MTRVLTWPLLAVAGVGVAVGLTALQSADGGDPLAGSRMLWLWVATVVWVVACVAAVLVEKGSGR